MAERLVNVDRQTPMLLPPDLREWVADNELAHLILEAVESCDMRTARLNTRGSGSEQYPATLMLALLIYAYAMGVFSSRRIERELERLGGELLQKAEAADAEDKDGEGTQLPEELRDGEERRKKLLAAQATILARRQAAREAGRQDQPGSGCRSERASVSEPESRYLGRKGGQPVQGYNAQAVIDAGESGLIVGAHLSDAPNDSHALASSLEALPPQAGRVSAVLVDKGYDDTEHIAQVEREHSLLVLCPPQRRPNTKAHNPKRRGRRRWIWQRRRLMEQRFLSPGWRALYRRRQPSAEGVFARIKNHLGFRRFQVWGKSAATSEWILVCLAHNCRMLAAKVA
jgi:hypothetical protein